MAAFPALLGGRGSGAVALIGSHVSIEGGLWRAFERGQEMGCEALQIFTKNQLQWFASPLPLRECERFYRAWRESGISTVVSHASYLINLAGEEAVRRKSVDALVQELQRCDALGIDRVVLHPGFHRQLTRQEGMKRVLHSLEEVLEQTEALRVRILLETMSGQGTSLGATLEECTSLCASAGDLRRVGVCLDLCHLFAAGYELRTPEGYERLVGTVERELGLDAVGCWHLNDSKDPKGSRKDRHAHPGSGALGTLPFSLVVSDRRFPDVPAILETPADRGKENLALLRKWRGRE